MLRPVLLKKYSEIASLLMKAEPTAADAEELANVLEELGPTFIKLGQLLSTRPDLLPPDYVEGLKRLQDDVQPISYEEVRRAIAEELGGPPTRFFSRFDREPIAAASLAQVHRAKLKRGGEVAVKVQRPGIRERLAQDLDALAQVAGFLDQYTEAGKKYEFRRIIEEFRKTIAAEVDFRQEAENMSRIGANLAEFDRVFVPQPIAGLTTSRVLTMEYVSGTKLTEIGDKRREQDDGSSLAWDLFRAYLQQILIDGLFHADPHPGNVLLTPDGRLALLDLGMVGRVAPRVQEDLLKMLLAIGEGEAEQAARTAKKLSEPRESFDEYGFERAVSEIVLRVRDATLDRMQVGKVVLEMTTAAVGHGLRVAPELTLLGKTLMNLDEIALALDPEFNPHQALRQHAPVLMQRRVIKDLSPGNLFSTALDVKDFVQLLPSRVNRILDALTRSELRLKVEMIDEGSVIEGLQKIANRITLGLVLAALIVGAAMLTRVDTGFRILGYPALAIVLFLAAASGGCWLAFNILRSDRTVRRRS